MTHVRRATPLDRCLDRHDPANGAYITFDPDAAKAQERSAPSGRLSDVVVAVKDLFDTAGQRTTYGSGIYADHVPTVDARAVERLRADGAVVIGKTNLDEFANGVTGHNSFYGTMRVPGSPHLTASGSSGGSAVAVAERSCDLALGTDSGGSVRLPAAACGVLGFKTAWSPQALAGAQHLAPSFDSLGYLTRRFDLLQTVLRLSRLPAADHVRAYHLGDHDLPVFPEADFWNVFQEESVAIHGAGVREHPEAYGPLMLLNLSTEPHDVASSKRVLAAWKTAMRAHCQDVDVIVAPLLTGGPPTVEEALAEHADRTRHLSERFLPETSWVNALGWPALAVPTTDGPVQVVAPPGSEATVLAYGRKIADMEALA